MRGSVGVDLEKKVDSQTRKIAALERKIDILNGRVGRAEARAYAAEARRDEALAAHAAAEEFLQAFTTVRKALGL